MEFQDRTERGKRRKNKKEGGEIKKEVKKKKEENEKVKERKKKKKTMRRGRKKEAASFWIHLCAMVKMEHGAVSALRTTCLHHQQGRGGRNRMLMVTPPTCPE